MRIFTVNYKFYTYMSPVSTNIKLPMLDKVDLEKIQTDLHYFLKNKKPPIIRKAVLGDFVTIVDTLPPIQYEKLKNYRIQDEYGEKKFIKP